MGIKTSTRPEAGVLTGCGRMQHGTKEVEAGNEFFQDYPPGALGGCTWADLHLEGALVSLGRVLLWDPF